MMIPERLDCGADPDMSSPWCLCLCTFGRVVTDGSGGGIRARFISHGYADTDPLKLVFLEDKESAYAIVTPDPHPNPAARPICSHTGRTCDHRTDQNRGRPQRSVT